MTKAEVVKDVVYYLSLPYTIILRTDEEGDYVAKIQELPGCIAHGTDPNDVLANLREVQELWIEERLSTQTDIPEPEPEEELPSGKWVQRVPRTLHQRLTELARKEQVSLNQLVTSMLSEAVIAAPLKHFFQKYITAGPLQHAWEGAVQYGNWHITVPAASKENFRHALNNTLALFPVAQESKDAYDPNEIFKSKETYKHARKAPLQLAGR